jgi:nucleotide-binding universal stress UspA family protein
MSSPAETQESERPLENAGDEPRSVLVAVDSSLGAGRVLSTAARFSRSIPGATLHVVHVFRSSRLDHAHAGAPASGSDQLEEAKEHLAFHVRAAKKQCRNTVMSHFAVGDPTAEVLRLSAELGADLLIVGTHDHVGFERLLLGSVAETLVRKAGCSVMVVRPTAHHK